MSDKQTLKTFKEWSDKVIPLSFTTSPEYRRSKEAWNAATETTRSEYDDKIKAMQAEIKKRDDLLMKYSMYCACKSITLCTVCWETEKILNQRGGR